MTSLKTRKGFIHENANLYNNRKDETDLGGIDFLLHYMDQENIFVLLVKHPYICCYNNTRTPEAKKDYRGTKMLLLCLAKRHNASHPLKTVSMEELENDQCIASEREMYKNTL